MSIKLKIASWFTVCVVLIFTGLIYRTIEKKNSAYKRLPLKVPILMYHDISSASDPETEADVWIVQTVNFEKHLQSLKKQGYTSVLPKDLAAAKKGQLILPDKPVIITFDDGFLSGITIAEPLLKQYGFQAMVYLITSKVADTPEERQKYRGSPCLVWPEVREAMQRKTLYFGIHSHTHPKALATLVNEIAYSRDLFRARIGSRPDSFCFPYGQSNQELERLVRDAGFTTAMICEDETAVIDRETNLLALTRISVFGGKQNFVVSVWPQSETGPNCVGGLVKNLGRPVRVRPRLLGTGLADELSWLPETRLGPQPEDWRWQIAPEAARQDIRLEIWDRNRILLLFTAP